MFFINVCLTWCWSAKGCLSPVSILFTEVFFLWPYDRGSSWSRSIRFNPLYWGVLFVTGSGPLFPSESGVAFQSSLLRCSFCDLRLPSGKAKNILSFQSSLLRCSFCDVYIKQLMFLRDPVSILFTEVFFLWPARCPSWSARWALRFQSSLLRCSFCDSGR